MAVLDFPKNPASQTPANTYGPTSSPAKTTNGVTYVYANSKWEATVPGGEGGGGTAGDVSYEYPGSGFEQTAQTRLEQYVSVKDFGAVGDGVTDDTAAIQKAVGGLSPGDVLVFGNGSYLINARVEITKDNVTVNLGQAIILNKTPVPAFAEQQQEVGPLFHFKGNNCSINGGHFVSCVSQGILASGIVNDNTTGFTASNIRFTDLVSTNTENKCIQTRHVDDVVFDAIVCKNIGKPVADTYDPTLSINYCAGAIVKGCIVDGAKSGGAGNLLYVENGSVTGNQFINVSNVGNGQNGVGYHIKFSNNITFTGNVINSSHAAIKISEDVNEITCSNNIFTVTGEYLTEVYAGCTIQGPRNFTFSNNVVRCSAGRALYIFPHLTTNVSETVITGNYIRGNYNSDTDENETPVTYGSGIQFNGGLINDPRGPVQIADNLFHNCTLWMFQATKSAIKGNHFYSDIELYNNTETSNDTALTIPGSSFIWDEGGNTNIYSDNSFVDFSEATDRNRAFIRTVFSGACVWQNNTGRFENSGNTYNILRQLNNREVYDKNNSFNCLDDSLENIAVAYFNSDSINDPGVVFYANANNTTIRCTSAIVSTSRPVEFYNPNGRVGNISTTNEQTTYATSSDYRRKENVVEMTGSVERVKLLKPSRFNFISDASKTVDGFIAHEAQEVVPEAVLGVKDEVDEEGNPVYQGIDQSKLVPLLTSALKEAVSRIEALEAAVKVND